MTKCLCQILLIITLLPLAFTAVSAQETVVDLPANSQLNPVLDYVTIENGPPFGGLDYDSYYQLSAASFYSGTITYHIRDVSKVSVLALSRNGSFASIYQSGLIRGYNSSNLGGDSFRLSLQPDNDLLLVTGYFGTFRCYLNQYNFAFDRVELDTSKDVLPYGVNILYSADGSHFTATQGKFAIKETLGSGRYAYLEEYSAAIPKSAQFIRLKVMNAPYLTAPDGSKAKNIESLLAVLQTTFTVEPDIPSSSSSDSSEESSSSSSSDSSSSSSSSSSQSSVPDESSSSSGAGEPGDEEKPGINIISPSGSSGGSSNRESSSTTRSYNDKVHFVPNIPAAEERAGRTSTGGGSSKRSVISSAGGAAPVAGDSHDMSDSSSGSSSSITLGESASGSSDPDEREGERLTVTKGVKNQTDNVVENPKAMDVFLISFYLTGSVVILGSIVLKAIKQSRLKRQDRKKQ